MVAPPTKGSSIWIAERSYARALIKAGGVIPVGLVDRRGPSAGCPLPSHKQKKKRFLLPPRPAPPILFKTPPAPPLPRPDDVSRAPTQRHKKQPHPHLSVTLYIY